MVEVNVCLIKSAAFGLRRHGGGEFKYETQLKSVMTEIYRVVRLQLTDNGNERLPGQNCCVWPPGPIKGGE